MTDSSGEAGTPVTSAADQPLPSFSEQLAAQLGGVRGLVESGIPVGVFIVANIVAPLRPAIVIAVVSALLIAGYRLARRESVRHALNGLFGVALGAFIAWKTGHAKDFYLPGILYNFGYALVLAGSTVFRRPLVGYVWAVLANGGKHDWTGHSRLVRAFQWVTIAWAGLFFVRGVVQGWMWLADADPTYLGLARLALGYPLWLAGLGLTVWAVRRATHPAPEPAA